MTLLATRGFVVQTECGVHVIACASITLRRVCRSTLTAETFQMEFGRRSWWMCSNLDL